MLAVVNSAAVNVEVHAPVWIILLSGYMPMNGVAGSYDSSTFSFFRNFHTVPWCLYPPFTNFFKCSPTFIHPVFLGFPGGSAGEESTYNAGDLGSIPGLGRFPLRRERLPTPVFLGIPGDPTGKEPTSNAGDLGSIPGLGRSPGEGEGSSLQNSGLENSMHCIAHGVAKSWT